MQNSFKNLSQARKIELDAALYAISEQVNLLERTMGTKNAMIQRSICMFICESLQQALDKAGVKFECKAGGLHELQKHLEQIWLLKNCNEIVTA